MRSPPAVAPRHRGLSFHDNRVVDVAAWLGPGTPGSQLQAANFVEVIESRQGRKTTRVEGIACRMGCVDAEPLLALAGPLKNGYGADLRALLKRPSEDAFD